MIASPPKTGNASRLSFQRHRLSIPDKLKSEKSDSLWIQMALPKDLLANVQLARNMILLDSMGTGATDLVFLEEQGSQTSLKVYNGQIFMVSDIVVDHGFGHILGIQLADSADDCHIPAVFIASGDEFFIYQKNACIMRSRLDPISLSEVEIGLWVQLKEFVENKSLEMLEAFINQIKSDRESGHVSYSYQMENLLSLESIYCIQDRIQSIQLDQKNQVHISSIASLAKRETNDGKSSSLIALGTLECLIYLISPPKYQVIEQFQLSSAIIQIETVGSYLGDYRIYALCADDCLYVVSRNKCKEILQFEETPTQFILIEHGILVSYMNSSVVEYDFEGQRKIKMYFKFPVVQIDKFKIEQKGINGFIVALKNKEIRFFHEGRMLFFIQAEDNISSFRFGQFKGEDMALAMILKNKTIQVHVLKRNFSSYLDDQSRKKFEEGFSKKSKAYVDCLRRERIDSVGIYDRFQRMDLLSKICQDRKLVAPYSSMPIVVDLNIDVIGSINPYAILLKAKNLSIFPAAHLIISIQTHPNVRFTPNIIKIPFLPPEAAFTADGILECDDQLASTELLCQITSKGRFEPILSITASVSFDTSDSKILSDKAYIYATRFLVVENH